MANEVSTDPDYMEYLRSNPSYQGLFEPDAWEPFEAKPDFSELDDEALKNLPKDWLRGKFENGVVTTKRIC